LGEGKKGDLQGKKVGEKPVRVTERQEKKNEETASAQQPEYQGKG